jgi:hypothetical protein
MMATSNSPAPDGAPANVESTVASD